MSKELLNFMSWVNQDEKLGYTSIGIERIVNRYITSKDLIIDEAYKNYLLKKGSEISEYGVRPILLLKEDFINKCKTEPEFSEKWGLKIEERELSLGERKRIYEMEYTNDIEVENNHWLESKLKTRNIPTKQITLTYNNETIEIYA